MASAAASASFHLFPLWHLSPLLLRHILPHPRRPHRHHQFLHRCLLSPSLLVRLRTCFTVSQSQLRRRRPRRALTTPAAAADICLPSPERIVAGYRCLSTALTLLRVLQWFRSFGFSAECARLVQLAILLSGGLFALSRLVSRYDGARCF